MTTRTDVGVPADENDALGLVEAGEAVGIPTATVLLKSVAATVAQPRPLAREVRRFGRETARIVRGRSKRGPAKGDKRFTDPAWTENPVFRRLAQEYLNFVESVDNLVDELDHGSRDWQEVERARFFMNILTSAVAPTNLLLTNPAAMKRLFDTAGASVVRGLANFLGDVRSNRGMPSQTNRKAFQVGTDLAASPGSVVQRDALAELIQYEPTTESVRTRPVLIIPPPIGRYYFLDLRPGRSFVEYAVGQGLQVFMISWRNPDASMGSLGVDDYAARVLSAIDAMTEITGSPDVTTVGFCAGGILQSGVLNHLAAEGDERIAAASFAVTLLDFDSRAAIGAFSAPRMLELAQKTSQRDGIITGRQLSTVFAWMRPDELVFNYWVSNYLMGFPPPTFDILAWNADSTNLPARLHAEFLDIFKDNVLATGDTEVLGTPVDLKRITVPSFVTGAVTDHLTPWKGCYRTTELLSGPSTFVLSNAGHIASLVNPPGNPKASYYVDGESGAGPDVWLKSATRRTGSWWQIWVDWSLNRAGDEVPAPDQLGSTSYPPLQAAPGGYVRDKTPS